MSLAKSLLTSFTRFTDVSVFDPKSSKYLLGSGKIQVLRNVASAVVSPKACRMAVKNSWFSGGF